MAISHHLAKKSKKRFNFAKLIYFLLIIYVVFCFYDLCKNLREGAALANTLKASLSSLDQQTTLTDGEALNLIKDSVPKIQRLNQIVENSGQNFYLLSVLPQRKSKLTSYLDLLYSANLVLDSKKDLGQLDLEKILNQKNNSILDLKTLTAGLSLSISKVQKRVHLAENRLNNSTDQYSVKTINYLREADNFLGKAKENNSLLQNYIQTNHSLMIIFQNNDELRGGSGGSFGSFGITALQDGLLSKIDFGTNIYKLDNAFIAKEKITPPAELAAYQNWTLKNAGIAVDGKEALDNIRLFYNKETGKTVDGVITVDTTAFSRFLAVVGEIDMPAYNTKVNKDNFKDVLENEVQKAYFDRAGGTTENEPKKIIGDLLPVFMDRLESQIKEGKGSAEIAQALTESLSQKNILFNFEDQSMQHIVEEHNWAGTVAKSSTDYLYINNSNIGGAKTDQKIEQDIKLTVNINKDGTLNNELIQQRIHRGSDQWPDGFDQNFVRVLLPNNSKITSFTPVLGNMQVWGDRGLPTKDAYYFGSSNGKTVLNYWLSTKPKEKSQVKISYTPSYKINMTSQFDYEILLQRQPGAKSDKIDLIINYPEGYAPSNVLGVQAGVPVSLHFELATDRIVKIHFKSIK